MFGNRQTESSVPDLNDSGPSTGPSTSSAHPTVSTQDSLLVRAEVLRLKNRKKFSSTRNKRRSQFSVKEMQKGLVVIDYHGDVTSSVSLSEDDKLYDGSIRYTSNMSESEMRNEIVRLVKQKKLSTHHLQLIKPEDFDFVRCINRTVKVIDGDTPFDANGISQVYKNGCIYVRLTSSFIQYVRHVISYRNLY